MFRKFDIVGVPDGRCGMVDKPYQGKGVVVRFGADGPIEIFRKNHIRFVSSEELECSGGRDFFRETRAWIKDTLPEGVSRPGEGVPVDGSMAGGTDIPGADHGYGRDLDGA